MLTNAADAEDVLSATLSRMKLKALGSSALDAAGRWAIEFPAVDVLRLHVVLAGDCWLAVAGERATYHMRTGDCFLVPHAKSLVMASDLSIKKRVPLHQLKWTAQDGVLSVVCNGGGGFFAVGSSFRFDGHFQNIVLGRLPPVIRIPAQEEQAAVLRWSLDRFAAEVRNRHAGRALMLRYLAPIMPCCPDTARLPRLGGAREELVRRALGLPPVEGDRRHADAETPREAGRWTTWPDGGLSRAGFALSFKKWIGVTPMEYLTQWRMQLACELLRGGDARIAEVAERSRVRVGERVQRRLHADRPVQAGDL